MTTSLVLTFVGGDRPGIVESLSEIIVAHQGEWIESRMATMAGKFAGILRVTLPESQVEKFTDAIHQDELEDLRVLVEVAEPESNVPPSRELNLALVGQDRPGIVHQISQALAKLGVSVDELETEVTEASMSGEHLFNAQAKLHIPLSVPNEKLQEVLESLADELMVDIELDDETTDA